jgi:hypothetical protein
MTTTTAVDLSALTQDGDTLELEDGRTLRLRLEPDQDASINDYESDGSIEWTRNNAYGPVRPDNYTGRARILNRDRGQTLWWEPPSIEMVGTVWTDEEMRKEEGRIRMLAEFGFVGVILEVCDKERDAYGALVVREQGSLWGIEWDVDAGYLQTVLSDLAAELEL